MGSQRQQRAAQHRVQQQAGRRLHSIAGRHLGVAACSVKVQIAKRGYSSERRCAAAPVTPAVPASATVCCHSHAQA